MKMDLYIITSKWGKLLVLWPSVVDKEMNIRVAERREHS
jgi:hypothetical protein